MEFKQITQGARENIAAYGEAKLALYRLAYPEGAGSFPTLRSEFIFGIFNNKIKRKVAYAPCESVEDLRKTAISFVAIEREAVLAGYGDSETLDGLSAVTWSQVSDN